MMTVPPPTLDYSNRRSASRIRVVCTANSVTVTSPPQLRPLRASIWIALVSILLLWLIAVFVGLVIELTAEPELVLCGLAVFFALLVVAVLGHLLHTVSRARIPVVLEADSQEIRYTTAGTFGRRLCRWNADQVTDFAIERISGKLRYADLLMYQNRKVTILFYGEDGVDLEEACLQLRRLVSKQ